jgi:hypothetical protein
MALGFEQAIKLLEGHIEILKQNLRFFVANYKAEYTSKIVTIKRELDKAVQVRMKSVILDLAQRSAIAK